MNLRFRHKKINGLIKKWAGILFGLVFLYLTLRRTDYGKVIESLSNLNWLPLIILVVLRILALFLRGFRWQAVLEHEKKISPVRLFRITSIGEMGNYLLPARFGELMRIFIVSKREDISKSTALGSVFADRFLDFLTVGIIFFVLINFIEIPDNIKQIGLTASVYLIISIFGILVVFFLVKRFFHLKLTTYPQFSNKINQALNHFSHSLIGLRNLKTLFKSLIISIIIWFINIISLHLVIISLNLELAWYYSGMTIVIIALGMIIPSTPGYIGTYEFFCVSSLTYFSIEKNSALVCALVSHGLLYVVILGVGIICYLIEIIPLKNPDLIKEIKAQGYKNKIS